MIFFFASAAAHQPSLAMVANGGFAALFSSSDVKGPERFDAQQWTSMASGVPALIEALAVLDCEVIQETEVGQHSVFFCEVKNARSSPAGIRSSISMVNSALCSQFI